MDNPEFPPNSEVSKKADKQIERVTSGSVTRKKKSLRKQFSETFVAGDARGTVRYVMLDVMLPAAKDLVVEAAAAGVERLIFGESRRRRYGSTTPTSGPAGYIQYNRMASAVGDQMSRLTSAQRVLSRQARARHDFDEIVLASRTEAEEVIDRLFDLVSRYETATVADLYELVGLVSSHTDHKWGWTDVRGAGVSRVRDGYLLDLPEPRPLS
jgi:hypothetical protein